MAETRLQMMIRCIVPNLRNRWREELKEFDDDVIAAVYEHFSLSDDHGNNDEKFPEWFDVIST